MDFLRSLNQIEKTDTLIQCIKVCIYNIIEIHDPNEDYKNYTYMDKHIRQHHGIAWMIDNYFHKSNVNKYYSILMTNLLNPSRQSILKLTNTFTMDDLNYPDYKYFLIKLIHFNSVNKLKRINIISNSVKKIFNTNESFDNVDDIIKYLGKQHIYSHQKYTEITTEMDIILVEQS
jgi:hypothetical protein